MRPNPPHDPTVETVKESSDVGSFVVFAPTPQKRIKLLDQLLGFQWHVALSALPHLVHETTDRFLARIRIERTPAQLATNLAFRQTFGQARNNIVHQDLYARTMLRAF